MLYEFVSLHRDEIIRRCRAKVALRSVPAATPAEIEHGVPLFLDQLVTALHRGQSGSPEINGSAVLHGHDLLLQGLSVSQVVHDYGDVCQSITELAVEVNAPISTDDFRMLNGCLDGAIAGAVTEFARESEQGQAAAALTTGRENEQLGFLAHELRDLIHTVTIAFDVLKSGHVGVGGSTSKIIDRSLLRARDLISRSLAEVRFNGGADQLSLEEVSIPAFIDELVAGARLEANARSIRLNVVRGGEGAAVNADRQVLATAVMNLLQNALKFSRSGATVTLRVRATADRVLLEIQDECGGIAGGDVDQLFRPFHQRHQNRSGIGLGLTFAQKAIEAVGGGLSARNLPLVGCIFSVDLPRVVVPAVDPTAALRQR